MKVKSRQINRTFVIFVVSILSITSIFGQSFTKSGTIIDENPLVIKKIYDFCTSNEHLLPIDSLLNNQAKFEWKFENTFSVKTLPIFCKIEEKVSQKSNLAMRMRLGSLEYVNFLENKPSSSAKY